MSFLDAPGNSVTPESLKSALGRELVVASRLPFVKLVEVRALDNADVIVLDFSVERPRDVVHEIRHCERIAVICFHTSGEIPEVLALRDDFPLTPHINLRSCEFPRSLCLYDEAFELLQLRNLTGAKLIRRIREWLALTAIGELHADDQPLEPIMLNSQDLIIVPPNIHDFFKGNSALQFGITKDQDHLSRYIFRISPDINSTNTSNILCIGVVTQAILHGVIRSIPKTLDELSTLLSAVGYKLLPELRKLVREQVTHSEYMQNNVILFIALPKVRSISSPVERIEWRAFVLPKLQEVAVQIGVCAKTDGEVGLLLSIDESCNGQDTNLNLLDVVHALTQDQAALLNGLGSANTQKIVQIGVGALGSQVFSNLYRAGFGQLTLVDNDRLMPHNLARHALSEHFIGQNKANSMALLLNKTLSDNPVTSIPNDIFKLNEDELKTTLSGINMILDCSASVPVARYLAKLQSNVRRVSLFLSPNGKDLVLLAEDSARQIKLDQLEAQYYEALIEESSLEGHLAVSNSRIRYGASCRDVSSIIPQDLVALHAAIGSRAVKQIFDQTPAQISIWRINDSSGEVSRIELQPKKMHVLEADTWKLHVSESVLDEVRRLRNAQLPKETGGTLIGMLDLCNRNIYLTGILKAPDDSVEYPTHFIRGSQGLVEKYRDIATKTLEMLEYLGEWHTHPNGCTTLPSNDDKQVLEWIRQDKDRDGEPSLMVIVGEKEIRFFVTDSTMDNYLEVCL